MGEPRCAQTDLLVSQCAHCRPASEPDFERPSQLDHHDVGPVFTARFDGLCACCSEPVFEGDELRMVDGEPWCVPCVDNM